MATPDSLGDDPTGFLHQAMPLCGTLGIELESADPHRVVLTLQWAPELCTAQGVLHGGALMALADSAGALCAFLNLPESANTATIESKTNFLAAVRDGVVTAVSTPSHVGSSTIVVETAATNADRLVAKAIQTQTVVADTANQS